MPDAAPAQVLRFEARKDAPGGALTAHILGFARPPNAAPRDGLPAVQVLVFDVRAARAAAAAALAARGKRRGRKPARSVDFLIAGPPPGDGPDAWPLERVDAWARDSLAWIRAALPDAPIACAALHLDERSPHVHVQIVPIVQEGERQVLGFEGVKRALAAAGPALAPGVRPPKGRHLLSRVQDAYQHAVGRRYGLDRGKVGSVARHIAVNPIEGARRRASDIEAAARVRASQAARQRIEAAEKRTAQIVRDGEAAAQRRDAAEQARDAVQRETRAALALADHAAASRAADETAVDVARAAVAAANTERQQIEQAALAANARRVQAERDAETAVERARERIEAEVRQQLDGEHQRSLAVVSAERDEALRSAHAWTEYARRKDAEIVALQASAVSVRNELRTATIKADIRTTERDEARREVQVQHRSGLAAAAALVRRCLSAVGMPASHTLAQVLDALSAGEHDQAAAVLASTEARIAPHHSAGPSADTTRRH